MEPEQDRIEWVDLASGILLTWVMIFHALCYKMAIDPRIAFPYLSFSMPWFFYKSGMFFNTSESKNLFLRDIKKMVSVYIVWVVIGYLVYLTSLFINDDFTARAALYSPTRTLFLTGATYGNAPMWFLPTLFLSRQFSNWLLKRISAPLIILIGWIIATSVFLLNLRLMPFWIANTGSGIAFFAAGYWFKKKQNSKWLILLCLSIYAISIFYGFIIVDQRKNTLIQGCYYLWIPVSICSIIAFNTICKWASKIVRVIPHRFRIFNYISRKAMVFYPAHMVVLTIVTNILCAKISVFQRNIFLTIIICYICTLPIIGHICTNRPSVITKN